ncbi:MAG: hypothetical protein M1434_14140 [Chloroflexi bacterium]|nr:hypothetical protein [Chloroflexota bacterium]MCL5275861.1 hypothetical protein [Chloroflexota bacterium]
MFVIKGIIHLIWHIVTFPLHLVFALIKYLVITPIVLVIVLAVLIFACVAVAAPGVAPSIQWPGFINDLAASFHQISAPTTQATQVTCAVRGKAIIVEWVGARADAVNSYMVLRKSLADTVWQRIALVRATNNPDGVYQFSDTAPQHGATYLYGIASIRLDGSEGQPVESAVQVVAP